MRKFKILDFEELGDDRGHLVVAESQKQIPFTIKRIFYIYGTKDNIVRGKHANRISEFVLINLQGSVKIRIDDGKSEDIVVLDKPHRGVYLESLVWKDMYDFSSDSILLVLSDSGFDGEEYIRDYDQFLDEVNGKKVEDAEKIK